MSDIFICYAPQDLKFSEKIHQTLAKSEMTVWVDWVDIQKTEPVLQTILQSIEKSSAFIYLLSPSSVESDNCQKELDHAVRNNKRIIPIVIQDVEDIKNIPLEISTRNWIFCREGKDSFEKAIEEIRNTIHTDYEWLEYHTKLQRKALNWEQNKYDDGYLLIGEARMDAEHRLANIYNTAKPQPTSLQLEFIAKSRIRANEEMQQVENRRRRTLAGLFFGAGLLLALCMLSVYLYIRLTLADIGIAGSAYFITVLLISIALTALGVSLYYNVAYRGRGKIAPTVNSESKRFLKVFFCHSSKDKPKVIQYYARLKKEKGIDPWLDMAKLLPGVDWDLEIRSAVRSSDVVLVFLSKYSVNKEGYIQKELRQALDVADEKPDGTIFIIPLRLEDCEVPERLKRWQWLNLYENDSYEKLLVSLGKRADELATKDKGSQ